MRIMITGGGTGGHVFPAVAVVEELGRRDPSLVLQWVGKSGGVEERVCAQLAIPFRPITVMGWPRRMGIRRIWALFALLRGFVQAYFYLLKFKPDAVFAVGGYVCLPLAYVAERLGIKVFLHEQNRRLGMANRLLAPRAERIFLSFADTVGDYPRDKALHVGNPVRSTFFNAPSRLDAKKSLGLEEGIPVVLVVGGSQGARRINEAVAEIIHRFQPRELQMVWVTGTHDVTWARQHAEKAPIRVEIFSFMENIVEAMAAADLIVARSGASFTAELAAIGRPAILIPYPHAAEGHQEENALAFVERNAAVLLTDAECTGDRLFDILQEVLASPSKRECMEKAASSLAKPGAAERIVDEILAICFGQDGALA